MPRGFNIVKGEQKPLRVSVNGLEDYLGKAPFRPEKPTTGIGVITGLAWTAMGGATLNIEATQVHTKNRGFKLTGRLGEVMQESELLRRSQLNQNLFLAFFANS